MIKVDNEVYQKCIEFLKEPGNFRWFNSDKQFVGIITEFLKEYKFKYNNEVNPGIIEKSLIIYEELHEHVKHSSYGCHSKYDNPFYRVTDSNEKFIKELWKIAFLSHSDHFDELSKMKILDIQSYYDIGENLNDNIIGTDETLEQFKFIYKSDTISSEKISLVLREYLSENLVEELLNKI